MTKKYGFRLKLLFPVLLASTLYAGLNPSSLYAAGTAEMVDPATPGRQWLPENSSVNSSSSTSSGAIASEESTLVGEGKASYYANRFHGKKTANGEAFSLSNFTAAHRTLPFGTSVKVINLDNGKNVVVRINDRGPYQRGRIIDVSPAAAKEIGLFKSGTAKVRIEAYN
jgi:rare lipoprotein A